MSNPAGPWGFQGPPEVGECRRLWLEGIVLLMFGARRTAGRPATYTTQTKIVDSRRLLKIKGMAGWQSDCQCTQEATMQ